MSLCLTFSLASARLDCVPFVAGCAASTFVGNSSSCGLLRCCHHCHFVGCAAITVILWPGALPSSLSKGALLRSACGVLRCHNCLDAGLMSLPVVAGMPCALLSAGCAVITVILCPVALSLLSALLLHSGTSSPQPWHWGCMLVCTFRSMCCSFDIVRWKRMESQSGPWIPDAWRDASFF
jgi:hypothetical protein